MSGSGAAKRPASANWGRDMRFRVRFEYNQETGEVETFRIDALADGPRAADHDRVHDQVSTELAGVVERDAGIVEEPPGRREAGPTPPLAAPSTESSSQREALPPEALGG